MTLALALLLAQVQLAERDLCEVVKSVLRAAPNRFQSVRGAKEKRVPGKLQYLEPLKLPLAASCKVVVYDDGSQPFYGCEMHARSCKLTEKQFEKTIDGIPVLKYEAVIAGEVQKPGLGPLHTEFDDKGYAYTSMFISSEIVKWKLGTWEVVDRVPTYYSIGHLMIPGGGTRKPTAKYVIALNKITKDRYLPTGPELTQSAQLYDITGDKMKLLLDFPTEGEPPSSG